MSEAGNDRLVVAMYAFSAMKAYIPVFPNDTVPFQAIHAAIAVGQGDGEKSLEMAMLAFEEPVAKRLRDLDTMIEHYELDAGWLVAAAAAMRLVNAALEECVDVSRAGIIRVVIDDALKRGDLVSV